MSTSPCDCIGCQVARRANLKRLVAFLRFVAIWVLQGIGIGVGLCIALPLSEAVRVWLT